jgi:hypothetical protein
VADILLFRDGAIHKRTATAAGRPDLSERR